jgi:hypothetical protein
MGSWIPLFLLQPGKKGKKVSTVRIFFLIVREKKSSFGVGKGGQRVGERGEG